MTDTPTSDTTPDTKPRKHRRIFPWVFLLIQVLFLVWIITGTASGHANCGSLDAQTCANATNAGKAIGAGLIIALWVAVDVILGVTYAIFRMTRRSR